MNQKDLAAAISRMIGAGDRTTLEEMYGAGDAALSGERRQYAFERVR